ncbi:MAG: Ppx/GppA phosphatase family protein [Thermoleophilaceae bacterium]
MTAGSAPSSRTAVVDIGTNSTRLLIADVRGGEIEELERRTNVTRLGEGVDSSGELAEDAMGRVFETLASYREAIDELGAERVVAVATSAVRDAANGERFRAELRERFAIEAAAISGDEEARLTFLGATSGRAGADRVLVVDIGGGSTEFVIGTAGGAPSFHSSTELGSVRQTERHLSHDPPPDAELEELAEAVRSTIEDSIPAELRSSVPAGIAVAGTATSLAAIAQELDPYDPERVHGYELDLPACERMLAMLAALPVARRREVAGLHPDRAPTVVAGVAILVAAIEAFGLESIEVSEADILHGAALDAARDRPPGAAT